MIIGAFSTACAAIDDQRDRDSSMRMIGTRLGSTRELGLDTFQVCRAEGLKPYYLINETKSFTSRSLLGQSRKTCTKTLTNQECY